MNGEPLQTGRSLTRRVRSVIAAVALWRRLPMPDGQPRHDLVPCYPTSRGKYSVTPVSSTVATALNW